MKWAYRKKTRTIDGGAKQAYTPRNLLAAVIRGHRIKRNTLHHGCTSETSTLKDDLLLVVGVQEMELLQKTDTPLRLRYRKNILDPGMLVKEAQEMQGNVRKRKEVVAEVKWKGCGVLTTQRELRGIQRKFSWCFLQFPTISLAIPAVSLCFLRFPWCFLRFPWFSCGFLAFPSISLGNVRKAQEKAGSDDFCPIRTAIKAPDAGQPDGPKLTFQSMGLS
jgi:hypothetical protein